MLDPPSRAITNSQLAFERQGGEIVLGLADQVDGKEPGGERELGAMKERSGHQRGLLIANPTLKSLPGADMQYHSDACSGNGNTDIRPDNVFSQGPLCTVLPYRTDSEIPKGNSRLKLNAIHGHFEPPFIRWTED